jgi:radical SAM protein with 4Fe4S-binding SPASM domain
VCSSDLLAAPESVKDILPDWRAPSIVERPLNDTLPSVCALPFSNMVISWNGDVYPCCVVDGDEYKLGNLVTQTVDEVWFGEEYVKCRSFLRHYGPSQDSGSVCQNHACPVSCKSLH